MKRGRDQIVERRRRPVSGQIDRLAVLENEVIILDYKTGASVPSSASEVSSDMILQMALYRSIVARIYTQRSVRCFLVWTQAKHGPHVTEVSSRQMESALLEIAQA